MWESGLTRPLTGKGRRLQHFWRMNMPSDQKKFNDLEPLEKDFGKEWGDDSLLDIEQDLEGLDDSGDWEVPGEDGMDLLSELEEELDELEEFMDSHWSK